MYNFELAFKQFRHPGHHSSRRGMSRHTVACPGPLVPALDLSRERRWPCAGKLLRMTAHPLHCMSVRPPQSLSLVRASADAAALTMVPSCKRKRTLGTARHPDVRRQRPLAPTEALPS